MDKLYDLVEVIKDRCSKKALCTVGYGHIGDGNLHLNVVGKERSTKLLQLIEPFVYDWTGKSNTSLCDLYISVVPYKRKFCGIKFLPSPAISIIIVDFA